MYNIYYQLVSHNVFIVINYCFDMFRPQFSAIFREFASLSMCPNTIQNIFNYIRTLTCIISST
jgi:hypothetical protein